MSTKAEELMVRLAPADSFADRQTALGQNRPSYHAACGVSGMHPSGMFSPRLRSSSSSPPSLSAHQPPHTHTHIYNLNMIT